MSLLPPIYHDIAMGGVTTEEKAMDHNKYLEFVYSQSSVFYDIIKYFPQPSIYPNRCTSSSHENGFISSFKS